MARNNTDHKPEVALTESSDTRLPGRLSFRPVCAVALVSTLIAAVIAIRFAAVHKAHVLPQTALAYGLLWMLILFYGVAYSARRILFRFHLWLTLLAFSAVLCFVHIDDASAQAVHGLGDPRVRPAPELYWAVALDSLAAIAITIHVLWLGRGTRPIST